MVSGLVSARFLWFPVGFPLFSTCLLRSVAVSYLLPAVSSGFPYVAVWLSVLKFRCEEGGR